MQLGDWRTKIVLGCSALCALLMMAALWATMQGRNDVAEGLMVASVAASIAGVILLVVFLIGSALYWRSKKE